MSLATVKLDLKKDQYSETDYANRYGGYNYYRIMLIDDKDKQTGDFGSCKDAYLSTVAGRMAAVLAKESAKDRKLVTDEAGFQRDESGRFASEKTIDPNWDGSRLRVVVHRHDWNDEAALNVIDFLNQLERVLHFRRSTVEKVEGRHGAYLYTGSRLWTHAPPLVSLYYLITRSTTNHKRGTHFLKTVEDIVKGKVKVSQGADVAQWQSAQRAVKLLANTGDITKIFNKKRKDNWQPLLDKHVSWIYYGIVRYSTMDSNYMKYQESLKWKYPDVEGRPAVFPPAAQPSVTHAAGTPLSAVNQQGRQMTFDPTANVWREVPSGNVVPQPQPQNANEAVEVDDEEDDD